MTEFGDIEAATRVRDAVRSIVQSELAKTRPVYRYGRVTSINTEQRTCDVLYAGETESVTVKIGSIFPRATGQYVRVAGLPGDRYVDDVLGDSGLTGASSLEPPTRIQGKGYLQGIRVWWTPSPSLGAGQYHVEVASNATFSQMIQEMFLGSTVFELSGLLPTQDYFVRVQTVDLVGGESVWTPVLRVVPLAEPEEEESASLDVETEGGEVVVFNQVQEVALSPLLVGDYVFDENRTVRSATVTSSTLETTETQVTVYKNGVMIGTVISLTSGQKRKRISLNDAFTGGEGGDGLTARVTLAGASATDVTVIIRAE